MVHGYSLRTNAKGRRRPQSTDETNEQVEGTSTSTSTNTSIVDPHSATLDTPSSAAHNPPGRIVTSSAISTITTTKYQVERQFENWEEIQAARKREQARSTAEAARIRREQIRLGYERELHALRARIVALHQECEVKVEKARKKWKRKWAIERGEIAVVVDPKDIGHGEERNLVGSNLDWEQDAEFGMAVKENYGPSSLTTNNDEGQWPSQTSASLSKSNFRSPPPLRRTQQQQQQQQQDDERRPGETRGRQLPLNRNHPSRPHGSYPQQPQPLRRQQAQMVVIPTPSYGTYGTAVPPETEFRFNGTDGDNDSEMGG